MYGSQREVKLKSSEYIDWSQWLLSPTPLTKSVSITSTRMLQIISLRIWNGSLNLRINYTPTKSDGTSI